MLGPAGPATAGFYGREDSHTFSPSHRNHRGFLTPAGWLKMDDQKTGLLHSFRPLWRRVREGGVEAALVRAASSGGTCRNLPPRGLVSSLWAQASSCKVQ